MRSTETIKRDIARAEARITKNTESIARLTARNEKYHKKLEEFRYTFKGDGTDCQTCPRLAYDTCYNLEYNLESIANKERCVAEDKEKLNNLKGELEMLTDKLNAIPQAIKDYEVELRNSLLYDSKERRAWALNKLRELKESGKMVSFSDIFRARREYEQDRMSSEKLDTLRKLQKQHDFQEKCSVLAYKTDEELEKEAKRDAYALITDLAHRVERCVGKATDCSGLFLETGTEGYAVLNGIVVGEKGRCEVVSKGVAGYNIVRWHIRVNVWKLA